MVWNLEKMVYPLLSWKEKSFLENYGTGFPRKVLISGGG